MRPVDKQELKARARINANERIARTEEIVVRDALEEDEELLRDEMDYAGRMTPEEQAKKQRHEMEAARESFKKSLKKAP